MSLWGGISVSFYPGAEDQARLKAYLDKQLEHRTMPTGSEEGPLVLAHQPSERLGLTEHWVSVAGRLRDVTDEVESPKVLAWFTQTCDLFVGGSGRAELEWEIDGGPRYRYEWRDGRLTKLRGVLD